MQSESAGACIAAFKSLQDRICTALEDLDGKGQFREDLWDRPGGGGGRTRVMEGGLIEKGGVNFSAVHGTLSEQAGKALGTGGGPFLATGVSIVLHPRSPEVPIIHMNVRYFEMGEHTWWFGGGIDLTPHYVDTDLASAFHQQLVDTYARHPAMDYPGHKRHADQYFLVRHRQEIRGIGGVFFDRLTAPDFDSVKAFTLDVGDTFVPAYREQVAATRHLPFGERELEWQRLRRGRYVEFNLAWDRGTKFGLETNGRTESILMSMPPQANWTYDYAPAPGTREAQTQAYLKAAATAARTA